DDGEMLDRLRHDAVIGGNDNEDEIDAGGPGEHVVDEALMPRHIDKTEHPAAGRGQISKAEIDRDAARLLFLQAIGVDAGKGTDQRRLAVIDVAGCPDDHEAGSGKGSAAQPLASAISSGESERSTTAKNGSARALP